MRERQKRRDDVCWWRQIGCPPLRVCRLPDPPPYSGEPTPLTRPHQGQPAPDLLLNHKEVVDRNTAAGTLTLKWGREIRKTGRDPKENDQQTRKPPETQGPRPDLRGTCSKALTVPWNAPARITPGASLPGLPGSLWNTFAPFLEPGPLV